MGVKERTREKKKAKTEERSQDSEASTEDTVTKPVTEEITEDSAIEKQMEEIPVLIEREETEVVPVEEAVETPQLVNVPKWGTFTEAEWMYHIPTREEDRNLWAEEWADFLLEWAEREKYHVISLTVFITESPFKDILGKADAFKLVASVLVEKEIAEWIGKRKQQLRIYWRPLEDWVHIIYQWALETGNRRLDVKSIVIQEAKQDFAGLPEKDLYIILEIMVKEELAEWVDKKKGAIRIKI